MYPLSLSTRHSILAVLEFKTINLIICFLIYSVYIEVTCYLNIVLKFVLVFIFFNMFNF